jgi:mRNA interferase MazF
MAIEHHPKIGTVLVCDFQPGFREPEMVKRHPVIVVSPRLRKRDGLCTVVPLSTTPPNDVMPYHYKIIFAPPLPAPYHAAEQWVKADMLATVGFHRLHFLHAPKTKGERRRRNVVPVISAANLDAVHLCIRHALGMEKTSR